MMRTLQIVLLGLAAMIAFSPSTARAHSLAPLLLEIDVADEAAYALMLRRSARSTAGSRLRIELPESCSLIQEWSVAELRDNRFVEQSALMHCEPASLIGQTFSARGLPDSGVALLIRMKRGDDALHETLLDAGQSQWVVPGEGHAESVGWRYLWAGFEHLLIGLDHVLLVILIALLVRGTRRLVLAVTAFTLGHSLSLALASLGWIQLPQTPIELLIAASLVPLALELLRPGASAWRKHLPWLAVVVGLVHGLGFAGVLGDIGLPSDHLLLALLSFNLGIEVAQLLLVIAVIGFRWLAMKTPVHTAEWMLKVVPAYAIGSIACLWCLERTQLLLI